MAKDGKYIDFAYAPDRARYLKTGSDGTKTLYLDKLYELITKGQEVTHEQFIYAGSSLVAVHVSGLDHNGSVISVQTRYMHKDSLGSVDTITDGTGTVVDRMSFDPFGSRRQSNWREATVGINLIPVLTNRGFTGHEHIDEMDLIHMNGRVYDPTLGRFLSADPHIQSPYSTQSYNRYGYVSNNPLKYTDPSGYFLGGLFDAIGKVFEGVLKAAKSVVGVLVKPVLRAVADIPILNAAVQAVGCYMTGPSCAQFLAMYNGATTYAVTGNLKASLKSAAISYVSAKASAQVGAKYDRGTAANIIGNAVVQGTVSKLQGGSFKDGFVGAAFAAAFKPKIFETFGEGTDPVSTAKRITAAAVIGGTASTLGGGKFANGAVSGAFSQMLNGEQTLRKRGQMRHGQVVNRNPYAPTAKDFFELLGESFMDNFRVGSSLSAAFGTGASVSADHDVDFESHNIDAEIIKGAEVEWALTVSGTPLSSGTIEGFYQGIEVKAWGGIKVVWDYQGNWAVSTSLGFPVSHGGGVVSGYATIGRKVANGLMRK